MIGHCTVYREGERVKSGRMRVEEAAGERGERKFVWLDVVEPSDAELTRIGQEFDLPDLALEDAQHAHQRPKIEQYGESLFIVLRTAIYDSESHELELGEIHLFLGERYVVVVRHGGDPEDLEQIRDRAESRPELMRLGGGAVVYSVMDEVVDDFGVVIEELSDDIDELESEVFSRSVGATTQRIYQLTREVVELRRATSPLAAALDRMHQEPLPHIDEQMRPYFRDVYDHVERADERVEGFRDLLTGILQANTALVSVRQNEVVQKISGWAAIIAVPTLITGIYGMNFEHMPELKWQIGYPLALAAMVLVAAVLYRVLKRVGWL
jgi:magnesium transporter